MDEGLVPYLKDNVNAWILDEHGQYKLRKSRARPLSAQQYLMDTLGQSDH